MEELKTEEIPRAWVVVWDWAGDHAAMDGDEILAFFSPTTSIEFVRQAVEYIYAEKSYNLEERARWTIDPSKNPYKALAENGMVHCGHNPMLVARIVEELVLHKESSGKIIGVWKNR